MGPSVSVDTAKQLRRDEIGIAEIDSTMAAEVCDNKLVLCAQGTKDYIENYSSDARPYPNTEDRCGDGRNI